jgi:uncharacterized coiled-coil DUF342 family protein
MQIKITTEKDQLAEEMQTLHTKLDSLREEIQQIAEAIQPPTLTIDYSAYEPSEADSEVPEQNQKSGETNPDTQA